jgi:integrase
VLPPAPLSPPCFVRADSVHALVSRCSDRPKGPSCPAGLSDRHHTGATADRDPPRGARAPALDAPPTATAAAARRKAAGLDFKAHPHMLRHACGYALANAGHDTRSLQAYFGHRNIQQTVRYTELAPTRFKDFWKDALEKRPMGSQRRRSRPAEDCRPEAFRVRIRPMPWRGPQSPLPAPGVPG